MESIRTGLILEPILPEDYQFGGETKLSGEIINETGDWTPYLPTKEQQSYSAFDSQSCTSFGTTNAIETLHKKLFGIEPNYSDRFLSKISGTSTSGNTPKRVADAWRKQGIVPETDWPFKSTTTTWADFFADIPITILSMAKAWLSLYAVGYEYVNPGYANIKEALKRSPIGASFYAWVKDENGVYYKPENALDTHWALIIGTYPNGNYKIFDSYEPYIKEVRKDTYPAIAMRYSLTKVTLTPTAWDKFIQFLKTLFTPPAQPTVPLTIPPAQPVEPATERLAKLAERWIGQDVTPQDEVPDEVACVESLVRVAQPLYPELKGLTYTPILHSVLKMNKRFKATLTPKRGVIVVSPTKGDNKGHCGIFLSDQKICSNQSATGKWLQNYDWSSWIAFYKDKKKLHTYLYEPLN